MNLLDIHSEKIGGRVVKESTAKGGEYSSACPACGGRTDGKRSDRFRLWPVDGVDGAGKWWCRGCGKHGDAIAYLREFCGMSFRDACAALGRDVPARPAPYKTPVIPAACTQAVHKMEPQPAPPDPGPEWMAQAGKYLNRWVAGMTDGNPRLVWLRERGIRPDTAWRFRLCDNPGEGGRDMYRPREAWGLDPILKEDGKPKRLWMPRGLVIPCFRPEDGAVIRLRIRRDEETGPRYYVLPGGSVRMLWAGNPAARVAVVVESELDAVLVDQEAGDIVQILALGSALVVPSAEDVSRLSACLSILVALDADAAGASGAAKWTATFPTAKRWAPPAEKDPGDYAKTGGNIREWIVKGLPPVARPPVASRLARSVLTGAGEGGGGGSVAPAPVRERRPAPSLPPEIVRLGHLLRASGVAVVASRHRYGIDFEPGRVSDAHLREISALLYRAPGVHEYLYLHPADVITAENIGMGGGA